MIIIPLPMLMPCHVYFWQIWRSLYQFQYQNRPILKRFYIQNILDFQLWNDKTTSLSGTKLSYNRFSTFWIFFSPPPPSPPCQKECHWTEEILFVHKHHIFWPILFRTQFTRCHKTSIKWSIPKIVSTKIVFVYCWINYSFPVF